MTGKQAFELLENLRPETEMVGPARANEFMAQNHVNRTMRESLAERYARDMRAGRWGPDSEPLMFDRKGRLRNGQHRMRAVILANVALAFKVLRNVPDSVLEHVDRAAGRSAADLGRLRGYDVSQKHMAVTVRLVLGGGSRAFAAFPSQQEILETYERYRDQIDAAVALFPRHTKGMTAPVLAAFARAWPHEPHRRLARLAQVLVDGGESLEVAPGERAMIRLRNKLLVTRGGVG